MYFQMKKNILLIPIATLLLMACSEDEDTRKYGNKQELAGTEWIKTGDIPDSEAFSPIRLPKEQTLNFENGSFTMTTQGSIYDSELHIMRDTTILTHGRYEYYHPTMRLTSESGNSVVEAWISPLNRICYYDTSDFCEFKKK